MTQPTLEQQIFHRSRLLMGDAPLQRLHDIRVILFGVGGVGQLVCREFGAIWGETPHHRRLRPREHQ